MVQGLPPPGRPCAIAGAGLNIRPILGRIAAADVEDDRLCPEPGGELVELAGDGELGITVVRFADLPDDLFGPLGRRGNQQRRKQEESRHGYSPGRKRISGFEPQTKGVIAV